MRTKAGAIRKPTSSPEINDILALLSESLKKALGDNLLGLYLTGSLAYGDFEPGRSDIDLIAIVKNPLSERKLKLVKQLHAETEKRYEKWTERIECSYLPVDLLQDTLPPKTPRPYWNAGIFYPAAPYGNEWIINQYFLYEHGLALVGPNFKTLVKPIDIKEVQKACVRDLFQEWEPKITHPTWLDNSHYQSYIVLNLCRILHTVLGGKVASKKAAAAWVKNEYGSRWKDLIETAENWYYGTEMTEKEKTIEFIKFVADKINEKR